MNAVDSNPIHNLSSVNDSDNDLSDKVMNNLFKKASIFSDYDTAYFTNCESAKENMVNSSISERMEKM